MFFGTKPFNNSTGGLVVNFMGQRDYCSKEVVQEVGPWDSGCVLRVYFLVGKIRKT
jgi:hypothetical protein